jgi:hypothetical protein
MVIYLNEILILNYNMLVKSINKEILKNYTLECNETIQK